MRAKSIRSALLLLACLWPLVAPAESYREKPRTYSDPAATPHTGPVTIAFWNIEEFTHAPIKGRMKEQVNTHTSRSPIFVGTLG